MHFLRKIKAVGFTPTADVLIENLEVWKFKSLELLDPHGDRMDELLSNVKLTDNENSDVEFVTEQKMIKGLLS